MLKLLIGACFIAAVSAGKYDQYADLGESIIEKESRAKAGPCIPTSKDILGPYYKPNAPFQSISPRAPSVCFNSPAHDRLFMNGTIRRLVNGQGCDGTPVKALVDVWHADYNGIYSNISPQSPDFTCRVRFYTRNDGSFNFESIFPGRYDDGGYRPAHIHFRITPVDQFNRPTGPMFTTQLYFANDKYLSPNDSCQHCGSYQRSIIANVEHNDDIKSYVGKWNVLLAA